METKNSSLLNMRQRKLNKKFRKGKKKENLKTLKGPFKCMDQFFSKFCKPGVREGLGRLRAKGKQGVEGMFFKKLCSEYVAKSHLNEVNEIRKIEDINKMIGLEKVFLHKRQRLGNDNRKLKKSPACFRNISEDSNQDLKQCLLSPISFTFTLEENFKKNLNTKACISRKLDLEKEFASFVSKYEEAVDANVLCRLPKNGVLEEAIEALKKMPKTGQTECKKDELEANEFREEFKFLTQNSEPEVLMKENLFDKCSFPEQFLTSKKRFHNYESHMEKPLENLVIMSDLESENYNHSSFVLMLDKDGGSKNLNVHGFQEKDFEKPAQDFSIESPPIQFYRRNMF